MKDILYEWNPWWSGNYTFKGISREKIKDIIPWITRKEIISILGVRRSGKTTILFEIIEFLINNKTNSKNILFIKADDDRIKKEELIDLALDEYQKLINPDLNIFVFIDEIQEIKDWQKTLKRIYDLHPEFKLFITGSNASLLKEELGSFLAGRFSYFEIFPFNFREFLQANKVLLKNEKDIINNKNKIRNLLIEYVSYGSFPEVSLEKDEKIKKELINFYFDSIFYRDILKRKEIRNTDKLDKLAKYYLQNISSFSNFTKVAKLLELTTDSIVEYTRALEDAYLIFSINLFEFSYKKQIINPKKIYCVDTGIRNIVGFKFSEDIGKLYENIVFILLKRTTKEIYYWKNKYECDFIVKNGKNLSAIQVCYDINSSKERELKGIIEALREFKIKEGLIITDNYEAEERLEGKIIKFIPLWKWLLD